MGLVLIQKTETNNVGTPFFSNVQLCMVNIGDFYLILQCQL